MKTLTLVFMLALAGCGTFQKPSSCHGPSFKLNESYWDGSPSRAPTSPRHGGGSSD